VPYDPNVFASRLEATNVNLNCVSCGGATVRYSRARTVFFDLDEYDRIASDEDSAVANGTICGIRLCSECGYVHLYSLALLEERKVDGL
jgi:hypothetical protein